MRGAAAGERVSYEHRVENVQADQGHDPYIEESDATGVIGIDETAIRPEVMWKALAWAGTHVGIGAARKMGKGRFTLTPL